MTNLKNQKADLKIEYVPIEIIKPNESNPRKMTEKQKKDLKENIKKFNFVDPLILNRYKGRENFLIGGHQRLIIAKELGYTKVPVVFVDLDKTKETELLLRLNENQGQWNYDLLKNFDIDMLLDVGFDNSELSHIWDQTLETEDDNFNVEKEIEKIKKTNIKIGDLFQLGSHRLLCSDSTDPLSLKKLCGNKKADMIYCDPNFNIGLSYNTGISQRQNYGGKTNDKKSDADYKEFLKKTIVNGLAVSKDNLHIFYYCDQRYIGLVQTIYKELGIKNQRVCLWVKNGLNLTPQIAFNKSYEPCIYGTIGKPYLSEIKNLNEILNKEVGTGNRVSDDLLDLLDIWLAKRIAGQNYEHPTEKPITLHEKPLKRCSKPGDIILDLFAGSGSTILACQQLKRICYAIEIEPIFCQLIINRFEKYANQRTKKLN